MDPIPDTEDEVSDAFPTRVPSFGPLAGEGILLASPGSTPTTSSSGASSRPKLGEARRLSVMADQYTARSDIKKRRPSMMRRMTQLITAGGAKLFGGASTAEGSSNASSSRSSRLSRGIGNKGGQRNLKIRQLAGMAKEGSTEKLDSASFVGGPAGGPGPAGGTAGGTSGGVATRPINDVHFKWYVAQTTDKLKVDPEDFWALYNMALVHQCQGNSDLAISHYRRALVLKPDDANVLYNLSILLAEVERTTGVTARSVTTLAASTRSMLRVQQQGAMQEKRRINPVSKYTDTGRPLNKTPIGESEASKGKSTGLAKSKPAGTLQRSATAGSGIGVGGGGGGSGGDQPPPRKRRGSRMSVFGAMLFGARGRKGFTEQLANPGSGTPGSGTPGGGMLGSGTPGGTAVGGAAPRRQSFLGRMLPGGRKRPISNLPSVKEDASKAAQAAALAAAGTAGQDTPSSPDGDPFGARQPRGGVGDSLDDAVRESGMGAGMGAMGAGETITTVDDEEKGEPAPARAPRLAHGRTPSKSTRKLSAMGELLATNRAKYGTGPLTRGNEGGGTMETRGRGRGPGRPAPLDTTTEGGRTGEATGRNELLVSPDPGFLSSSRSVAFPPAGGSQIVDMRGRVVGPRRRRDHMRATGLTESMQLLQRLVRQVEAATPAVANAADDSITDPANPADAANAAEGGGGGGGVGVATDQNLLPKALAWNDMATQLHTIGRLDRSVETYRKALNENSMLQEAKATLGIALYSRATAPGDDGDHYFDADAVAHPEFGQNLQIDVAQLDEAAGLFRSLNINQPAGGSGGGDDDKGSDDGGTANGPGGSAPGGGPATQEPWVTPEVSFVLREKEAAQAIRKAERERKKRLREVRAERLKGKRAALLSKR